MSNTRVEGFLLPGLRACVQFSSVVRQFVSSIQSKIVAKVQGFTPKGRENVQQLRPDTRADVHGYPKRDRGQQNKFIGTY